MGRQQDEGRGRWWPALVTAALLGACSGEPVDVTATRPDTGAPHASDAGAPDAEPAGRQTCELRWLAAGEEPFERLSDYCFFAGDPAAHRPVDAVIPYDVVSTLYADDSRKMRFLAVPPGESIGFEPSARWAYPEGTVLIKTFYYPHDAADPAKGRRLIETRLLVRRGGEWEAHVYLWDEDQRDATYFRVGAWVDVAWTDEQGDEVTSHYRVPNLNQCKSCHGQDDRIEPLGPRTWQLNRDYDYGNGPQNQITHLASRGLLDRDPGDPAALPALHDPLGDGPLDARARAYLEANCAHCHNPAGAGGASGLELGVEVEDPRAYGVCRRPVAAGEGSGGLLYDVVPGRPDESILIFRMRSTDPELKMPELPTQTADPFGAELVASWIAAMEPAGCD